MPAVWPATLPQALQVQGFQSSPPSLVVRTPMEAGPAKLRRRATAGTRTVRGTIVVTKASQYAIFDAFFVDTLQGGALSFDWKNPLTGAAATLRFTGPPAYATIDPQRIAVTLDLEILP